MRAIMKPTLAVAAVLMLVLPVSVSVAGELSVEDAVERTLRNADAARRGRLEVQRSTSALRAAQAERFPSVSLSLSGSYLTDTDRTFDLEAGALGTIPDELELIPIPPEDVEFDIALPNTVYRATATLEQPLFTWGQISRGIDAARLDREIRRAELRETEQDLRRDVREVYFGAVFAREAEQLLAEMHRVTGDIVADRRLNYAEGTVTREAVLEAEAQLAELHAALTETRESGEDAREALAFYTRGGRPEIGGLSSSFRASVPTLSEPELVELALSGSPRRDALAAQRRQAEAAAAAARGDRPLLPQLGLEISLEGYSERFPYLEDDWRDRSDYTVIISIGSEISLFDSGRRRWSITEAEQRASIARTGLEELERGMGLEVRRAVGGVRREAATLDRREAEAAFAEERYRNAQVAYQNETITREEERLARLGALEAEAALIEARYELERALTRLEHTVADAL